MTDQRRLISRRKAIALAAASPLPFVVACSDSDDVPAPAEPTGTVSDRNQGSSNTPVATATDSAGQATLPPTPQCVDEDDEPTVAQTEGPFFTPNTPERRSLLEAGMSGTKLMLTGQVLSTSCEPVAGALIDFWQCDDAGEYDNAGFRLRGHQFATAEGTYELETIVPGLYPGRTRHIHVKVQAANQPVLTTQLYFPGEDRNAADGIFHPSLVIDMADGAGGKVGSFNFVLDV